ncbi:ABC transporter ATP-binding protein [Nitratireductor basaltis]|uniref:ABC transporter n=1 Tax=Nitratireductor basaltis TaxID=472175 RepID=A0A084UB25_9HYPH|nr:ABC transporter ATP-binding protein [Nitratireductor basaltis]KFB10161.1 ABC transporter [Nitratireductor basaltis]
MLELRDVSKTVSGEKHIRDVSLKLEQGSLNVLLGPTLSGKTTLMRLMAGLDKPTSGSVWMDGEDVTGVAVQRRSVAMVYQQFINYPAMTVYENIASPLRVAGAPSETIKKRVGEAAELLRLTPYLDRTPLELSGGQQQRTALARAIVKDARLVLLDEPLANLDYKLREELRAELPKIFSATGAIFVYATTEPSEALLLGGNTATLSEGRVTQFGPTVDVFRKPTDLLTARTFSDPPLNTVEVVKKAGHFKLAEGDELAVPDAYAGLKDGRYIIGFQPHHLRLKQAGAPNSLRARVTVTEITGSESFIHVDYAGNRWVMLEEGVHRLELDDTVGIEIETRHLLVFDTDGRSAGSLQTAA